MTTPALFNLDWYLARNPDVAEALEAGLISSAFEHFNLYGKFEGRAPGPLFNQADYLAANPDVAEAVRAGRINAYDHFLQYGASENRSPLSLFDPEFYLSQNPDVAAAVEAGLITATEHFLLYGQGEPRQINPFINLGDYLQANSDVAEAADRGAISPLMHLLTHGAAEGRDLGNGIDLSIFANDPAFTEALSNGNFVGALERVGEVAPFIPTFKRPAGWSPAADTPIPTDFVPPSGLQLRVPAEISIPPGTTLPDSFVPVNSGGNTGGGNTGGGNTGGGNTGGGNTGGGDTGGGNTGGGDTGGGDTGGGEEGDFAAVLDEDNFVVFENAPAGSITVESAVREDDELVITFQSSVGSAQLSVPWGVVAGFVIEEGTTLVMSELSELSSLSFVGGGNLNLVGTPAADTFDIQISGAASVSPGLGQDIIQLSGGVANVIIGRTSPFQLQDAWTKAQNELRQHEDDHGSIGALNAAQQVVEDHLTSLDSLQQQVQLHTTNLANHIDAFGEDIESELETKQAALDTLLDGATMQDLSNALEDAQENAAVVDGLRADVNTAQAVLNDFVADNAPKEDLLASLDTAEHALDLHKDLHDITDADAKIAAWHALLNERDEIRTEHSQATDSIAAYVDTNGDITALNAQVLAAQNAYQQYQLTEPDLLTNKQVKQGQLGTLAMLRQDEATTAQALANHVSAHGDVHAQQANLIAQITDYTDEHGTKEDLLQAQMDLPSLILQHADLIETRDNAVTALNDHAVHGLTDDLEQAAIATQNALDAFIHDHGDEEALAQKKAALEVLVQERNTLAQDALSASSALDDFFIDNGLVDRNDLQTKLAADQALLQQAQALGQAVMAATSAVDSHVTEYGTDAALDDAVQEAQDDLADHKQQYVYDTRDDLTDALAIVEAALLDTPEDENLLQQQDALIQQIQEHDSFVAAISAAEQLVEDRNVLRNALTEAMNDLDTFTGLHGDEETLTTLVNNWTTLEAQLSTLEVAKDAADTALSAHITTHDDVAAKLDEVNNQIDTVLPGLRTTADAANTLYQQRLQLESDLSDANTALAQFEDTHGTGQEMTDLLSAIPSHIDWLTTKNAELEALNLLVIARDTLISNSDNASQALTAFLADNGDEIAIQAEIDAINTQLDAGAGLFTALEDAKALRDGLYTLLDDAAALLDQLQEHVNEYGTDESLNIRINNMNNAVADRAILQQQFDDAQNAVEQYTLLEQALNDAQTALDQALAGGDPADLFDALTEKIDQAQALVAQIEALEDALVDRSGYEAAHLDAVNAMNDYIGEFGNAEALGTQLQTLQDLITDRVALEQALTDAETAYIGGLFGSQSPATGGWDVIINFNVENHHLSVGGYPIIGDIATPDVSIQNGIATFNDDVTLESALLALSEITKGQPQTVGFSVPDSDSLFVFVSDGVTGITASDTLIELVGQTGNSLIDILGGGAV